ncbi:MAG: helix-turn-helix domain-containing protein [Oscillospiraceae bacterium]|jgi:transcriptional regulator with XRE-family HTH domain|nr:helix-turn-helix domain-containing protein [Oscillospiraceae bacterium]
MSRLGDLLKLERTRRGLTTKQVSRMCGVADKYLIDVEAGTRIIADDQARRILKRIGLEQQNEAEFSLDAIAAAADLAATTAKARPDDGAYSHVQRNEPARESARPVMSLPSNASDDGGIFLSALSEVLRQVPVYDASWKVVDTRVLPIIGGRIEGGPPDRVLYFLAPDASCRGFRILPGDQALIMPAQSPVDGAIMLAEFNNHRALRKVKLDPTTIGRVTLQSYDREFEAETLPIDQVTFIGRAARIEITL